MDLSILTYSCFIPLLNSIHGFTDKFLGLESYGWAIVILTAAVKLLLTPLTYKQIKSTKKMQVFQPKLKELQDSMKRKEDQYKNNPEKLKEVRLELQQKMMNFYKDNGINPLGGCLPLLIQMPILLGLFWTFSGVPFKDKPIIVDVKVVSQAEQSKKQIKPATKGEIYVDKEGRRARISVNTKGLTLVEGEEFVLETSKVMGDAVLNPDSIKWNFFGDKNTDDHVQLEVLGEGKVLVKAISPGSVKVQAVLPSSVKGDSFFFIQDFGNSGVFNKQTGGINIDVLILLILFGLSIFLSSKLNAPKLPPRKPGEEEDPQVAMQRSMGTMMPIMMTGMMFFIPLPVGALLYMVVSGIIQSGQTYFAMKRYENRFSAK